MWPVRSIYFFVTVCFFNMNVILSSVATNLNFNERIRDYSVKENNTSDSNATTLLKQGKELYSHFVPIANPVTLKQEIPDNELSSSSYSRGLLHHSDYAVKDYEDGPYHYDHVYNIHNTENHGHHGLVHHSPVHFHSDHHVDHHGGYHDNHHHHIGHQKHYDHGLASKTLLWPIAGIALLGAAAALVSNPILLQLGVVSGRRKKRDTEELTGSENVDFDRWSQNINKNSEVYQNRDVLNIFFKNHQISKGFTKNIDIQSVKYDNLTSLIPHKQKFIPIPLKLKALA